MHEDIEGKTIAEVTHETINDQVESGLGWDEIYDRLTIRFTDGSEIKFRSQFCSTQHSEIVKEE